MTGDSKPSGAIFPRWLEDHGLYGQVPATILPAHVHVWYCVTEAVRSEAVTAALVLLSSTERVRHDRFRLAEDRRDYALAHALLRTTLSRYGAEPPTAWTFSGSTHGKPVLESREALGLSLSLSHTRGFVACALAAGADVGLDVESLSRAAGGKGIAERYFAPGEIADLARCGDDARVSRFLELWTLKEAFAKATGVGLAYGLPAAAFELNDAGRIVFNPPPGVDARRWQFAIFAPAARYSLAIALRRPSSQPWAICATDAADPMLNLLPVRTSI